MRKHFLILMLFALLPFAAWAENFENATVTVDDTYFGMAPTPATVHVVLNTELLPAYYTIDQTGGKFNYYTDANCSPSSKATLVGTTPAAGVYYLKINAVEPANTGWAAGKIEILPRPLQVTITNGAGQGTKVFNNKDNNDPDEVYGEVSAINAWSAADTYGTAITGADFTALKATMTVTRAAGKNVKANYAYNVSTTNTNYQIDAVEGGKFSITERTFPATRGTTGNTYSVTVTNNEKTYNGAFQYATVTVVDNSIGYTLAQATLKPDGTVNKANDYTVKYDGSESVKNYDADDYVISFVTSGNYAAATKTLDAEGDKKLKIAQMPLTIFVDDLTKAYDGTADIPAVTYTYSGLVGDDAVKENPFGANVFVAEYASPTPATKYLVGSYALVGRLKVVADFGGDAGAFGTYTAALNATTYPNYKVTFSSIGQLTVDPREVTITVANKDKFFGAAEPEFTFTVAAVEGNKGATTTTAIGGTVTDKALLEGLYSVVRSNAGVEAVGEYEKVLVLQEKAVADQTDAEKTVLLQYNIVEKKGNFEIKTAALTVVPKKKTITYGEDYSLSAFEIIATNTSGQRVTLTSTPTVEFKEAALNTNNPTDAGIYTLVVVGDITAEGYDGENATRNEGQFIIKQKELTAVLEPQVLMVDDTKAALLKDKVVFAVNPAEPADGLKENDVIFFDLDFNAATAAPEEGQLLENDATGELSTQAAADEWNGTGTNVAGAIIWTGWAVVNGVNTFTAAQATAYNTALGLTGAQAVDDGTVLTDDHVAIAKFYNSTLPGAKQRTLLAKAAAAVDGFAKGVKIVVPADVDGFANKNYKITYLTSFGKLTVVTNDALVLTLTDDDLTNINKLNGKAKPVSVNFTARNARALGGARKWAAGYWNTLVLPFDITVADLSKALGYAIVNVINPEKTVVNGDKSTFYGKLTMTGGNGYHAGEADADTKLAANKPFLLKTADDITGVKVFGTQTIVAPADADALSVDAGADCKFVGTYTTKAVTAADDAKIWFQLGNYAEWAFISADSENSWNILPTEAYIDMNQAAGVRSMTFVMEELDGSTTTIGSINADQIGSKLNVDGWFTLNGVKLQGAPTQKGIYINNGKKIVIK